MRVVKISSMCCKKVFDDLIRDHEKSLMRVVKMSSPGSVISKSQTVESRDFLEQGIARYTCTCKGYFF